MKINHIALYVQDLEKIKDFYIKYFRAVSNQKYHNPRTGLSTYFLSFEGEGRLEIMTRPGVVPVQMMQMTENLQENKDEAMPETSIQESFPQGYVHLAFSMGSKEKVDTLTALLQQDGYQVISNPRVTGDGYYESCVSDPEGNQIEIVE